MIMKMKTFSTWALSFLFLSMLSSCDHENLMNEEEPNLGHEDFTMTVSAEQKAGDKGYDAEAVSVMNHQELDSPESVYSGLKLNFQLSGVTKLELESVDGYALSGTIGIQWDEQGRPVVSEPEDARSILVFNAPDENGFTSGKDYYILTLPCDLYGGYRLSIYRDGFVAHYFGVHQTVEPGTFISPSDLVESELAFDDPDAPLVEEERPELDATTTALLRQYQQNPTEENKQALLNQMGIRYDKVVARKKAKLRELEREAKTPDLVEEMQAIVDEMVDNRDIRLEQQFLRLIDPRNDEDPNDAWMVLRGASAPNAYIGYAPVTNAEYAAFKEGFVYNAGEENYPVVNIAVAEATAYCEWLTTQDNTHIYRLPSDEEWILGAGRIAERCHYEFRPCGIRADGSRCLQSDNRCLWWYRLLGELLGMDFINRCKRFVHYQRRQLGFRS